MWSVDEARSWWDRQPWLVGCNFIPSTAVNQLEMWQEATFDRSAIELELGWAAGLWFNPIKPVSPAIRELQLGQSDIVSFHHYGSALELEELIDQLRTQTNRPLLCTEYLARNLGNRFETQLPIFRDHRVGAINWGLVSGKTQTIYPWWSWFDDECKPEPKVWFHDILRSDGTAFDEAEVEFLRRILCDHDSI